MPRLSTSPQYETVVNRRFSVALRADPGTQALFHDKDVSFTLTAHSKVHFSEVGHWTNPEKASKVRKITFLFDDALEAMKANDKVKIGFLERNSARRIKTIDPDTGNTYQFIRAEVIAGVGLAEATHERYGTYFQRNSGHFDVTEIVLELSHQKNGHPKLRFTETHESQRRLLPCFSLCSRRS